jgi:hypothetical protein
MKKLDSKNFVGDDENLKSKGFLLSSLVSVILIGILGISYIRSNSELLYPQIEPKVTKLDAEMFLNALSEGKEKEAIFIASRIIPDFSPQLPDPGFIDFLSKNGLGTLILNSKFNHFDYIRWKDAYEMQKMVNSYKEKKNYLELFFYKVTSKKKPKIKGENSRTQPYVSIMEIYKKDNACIEEQARLFASFAYQSGYEIQLVYFYDANRTLLHMLCELRKNNKVFIADFIKKGFFKDVSVENIFLNPEKYKDICSGTLIKSTKWRIYYLPAEIMDYKVFNMRLQSKLDCFGFVTPRFGENPKSRIEKYIEKYSKNSENKIFSYWNFPIKSLMSSSNFPKEWKLPESLRKK